MATRITAAQQPKYSHLGSKSILASWSRSYQADTGIITVMCYLANVAGWDNPHDAEHVSGAIFPSFSTSRRVVLFVYNLNKYPSVSSAGVGQS